MMQILAKAAVKAWMVMPIMMGRAWEKMLALWPEEVVSASPAKMKPSKANPMAKAEGMAVLTEVQWSMLVEQAMSADVPRKNGFLGLPFLSE